MPNQARCHEKQSNCVERTAYHANRLIDGMRETECPDRDGDTKES